MKCIYYTTLWIGLIWLIPHAADAQSSVSGKVTDEKGEGLPGAAVKVKDSTPPIGTTTNIDGMFKLTMPKGAVLVASFVGYKRQEVAIGSRTVVNIKMEPDAKQLEDVVVTGYRQVAANQFAGSAVKLKAEDIKVGGVASVDQMLQGQAAGVSVQSTSSVFGATPKIRIRGSSSITGINEPLWVVDGVALENPLQINPSELFSGGARNLLSSALGGINPNDIEDITILKDATATALYGTRAVNGVIVITTKRATRNQKLKVNYTGAVTLNLKPSIATFDVLNSAEEVKIREQLFTIYQDQVQDFAAKSSGAYGKLLDQLNRRAITDLQFREGLQRIRNNNTDWFDVLFRNSIQNQHSISASYGGANAVTRASLSYLGDGGYSLGQKVQRYTMSLSSQFFLSKKFSVETLIKYADRTQRNPAARVNPHKYASRASRAMSPYNPQGALEYYKRDYVDFNILNEIANDYIDIKNYSFTLQFQLKYQPIESLTLTGLVNKATSLSRLRESTTENSAYAHAFRTTQFRLIEKNQKLYKNPSKPADALPETTLPRGGFLKEANANREVYTLRGQASWNALNSETHHLNILAGTEVILSQYNEVRLMGYGYIYSSGTSSPDELALIRAIRSAEDYYATQRFIRNQFSFYGSANYTLLEKYILTASLRHDATNLSSNADRNRLLPTWTVAGAWSLGQEPFMENLAHVVSRAKLRASYGLRGNAGNRGPELVAYLQNRSRVYPEYNQLVVNVQEPSNRDIAFEKEYIFSGGIDATLFNRLDITLDYYHRNNFDLIGYRKVAPSLGYLYKQLNWATMRNEGVEGSIAIQPIEIFKDFRWQGVFNIGYNENTILSNYLGNNPTIYTAAEDKGFPFQGRPLTGLYAFRFAGLDPTGRPQYHNASGEQVYGFKSDNKAYGNLAYQGSRDPVYSGGFASTFSYKNFTLAASFVFNLGNVVRKSGLYRNNSISTLFRDDLNITGDYAHRWKVRGSERYTNIPKLYDPIDEDFYANNGIFISNAMKAYNRSDIRTVDASFLRLRMISLKYQFPTQLVQQLKLRYLTAELQTVNPIVFASGRLRGQDPEVLVQGTNIPPIKSFTLNLSVGF